MLFVTSLHRRLPCGMTRTKRASEDKPSASTANSQRQLKDTKLGLQGRSKLDRPKKSGRLDAVVGLYRAKRCGDIAEVVS